MGTVKVDVLLRLRDVFSKPFQGVTSRLNQFDKVINHVSRDADRAVKKVTTLEKRMRNFGLAMKAGGIGLGGLSAPLQGQAFNLIEQGKQFELGMAKIGARVNLGEEQIESLKKLAQRAGVETGKGFQEALAGALVMGKSGMSFNQIEKGLIPVMQLAQAENISTEESANILTNTLAQFNLGGEKAKEMFDKIAYAADKAKLEMKDFGNAMTYLGSAAALKGQSPEIAFAALAALSKGGIENSKAGQGTAVLLRRLQNPKFLAHLNGAGLEGKHIFKDEAMTQLRDLPEILKYLSTLNITPLMADLFAGADHAKAFGTLMQDIKRGKDSVFLSTLDEYGKENGAWDNRLNKVTDKQLDTLDGRLQQLKASWNNLGATLEEAGFIGKIKNAVEGLNAALNGTPDSIKLAALGLGMFGSGAASILDTVGNASLGIWGMINAFKALKGFSMMSLLNPYVLAFAALAASIAVIAMNWEKVKDIFDKSLVWILDGIINRLNDVIKIFNKLPSWMRGGISISPITTVTQDRKSQNYDFASSFAEPKEMAAYYRNKPSDSVAKKGTAEIGVKFEDKPENVKITPKTTGSVKVQIMDTGRNDKTGSINVLIPGGPR